MIESIGQRMSMSFHGAGVGAKGRASRRGATANEVADGRGLEIRCVAAGRTGVRELVGRAFGFFCS
jgi:hypothetical protein